MLRKWLISFIVSMSCMSLSIAALVLSLGRHFMYTGPLYTRHTRRTTLSLFTPVSSVIDVRVESRTVAGNLSLRTSSLDVQLEKTSSKEIVLDSEAAAEVTSDGLIHAVVSITGNYEFGICVIYYGQQTPSLATTLLLPVEAFGTEYYLFFLKNHPFYYLQLPENLTTVKLPRKPVDPDIRQVEQDIIDSNGPLLNPEQCQERYSAKLNGLKIKTDKSAGVIAGNCVTPEKEGSCESKGERLSDAAMEMLLPSYTAGRSFVLFYLGGRHHQGYVSVISLYGSTELELYEMAGDKEWIRNYFMEEPEAVVRLQDLTSENRMLHSSKPVQCYYVQVSGCGAEHGDPSMSSIIPTLLFFNRYMWSLPFDDGWRPRNFVILIVRTNENRSIVLDGEQLRLGRTKWNRVIGSKDWLVAQLTLKTSRHLHYVKAVSGRPFGCYLYGIGKDFGYMQIAGLMLAGLNKKERCNVTMFDMEEGDMLDNDCDGMFDEELLNHIDDDLDGKVDEDLISSVPDDFDTGPVEEPVTLDTDEPALSSLVSDRTDLDSVTDISTIATGPSTPVYSSTTDKPKRGVSKGNVSKTSEQEQKDDDVVKLVVNDRYTFSLSVEWVIVCVLVVVNMVLFCVVCCQCCCSNR